MLQVNGAYTGTNPMNYFPRYNGPNIGNILIGMQLDIIHPEIDNLIDLVMN